MDFIILQRYIDTVYSLYEMISTIMNMSILDLFLELELTFNWVNDLGPVGEFIYEWMGAPLYLSLVGILGFVVVAHFIKLILDMLPVA